MFQISPFYKSCEIYDSFGEAFFDLVISLGKTYLLVNFPLRIGEFLFVKSRRIYYLDHSSLLNLFKMKTLISLAYLLFFCSLISAETISDNFELVDGCLDEEACNYNPDALEDDGSCCYLSCGCTDISAVNYSEINECDDNSCLYLTDCSLLESNIEENLTVCRGGLVELESESEYADEFAWYLDGVLVGSESSWNYIPETAGNEVIHLVTSNEFCVDSTEVLLDVFVLESPELTHTGLNLCEGELTELTAISEFQNVWIFGGQFLSLNESVTIGNGGLYSVVNVDEDCVSNSVGVVVTVSTIPVAEITYSSTDFCEGTYVLLLSAEEGDHLWTLNGETYSTNSSTQTSLEGEFFLQIMNDSCASNIDSVVLIERPFPIEPELEFTDGVLYATDIEGVSYHWYVSGTEVAVTEDNFYTPTISGDYIVEVESEFGCETSSELLLVNGIDEYGPIAEKPSFYPNPMNDQGTLLLGLSRFDSMQIIDVNGKIIQEVGSLEFLPKVIIHSANLDFGIYYIRLKRKEGAYESLKFIVE